MGHYALLVPGYTGHLNPTTALARALQRRGHRVTFLSVPDAAARIERAGLEFAPIAAQEFPAGEWQSQLARSGEVTGLRATAAAGRILGLVARGILRDLPAIAAGARFDGLVMDQISVGAESVCEVIGLPLAVACSALTLHIEAGVPPPYFPWRWRRGGLFRMRNTLGQFAVNLCGLRVLAELGPYRFKHRLPAMGFHFINELRPSLVQVAQQPAFFDFPREQLPDHVHYTAPWIDDAARPPIDFPWERLDGRPLVFASFGSVQKQMAGVSRTVVDACAGLDVQLVLSLGRKDPVLEAISINNTVVVEFAPQLALLRRAALVITHAGLNTTLESLSAGVPLVALPISNDQAGNALRVEHLGLGRCIPFRAVTTDRLRAAVRNVLANPQYAERVRARAAELRAMDGAAMAAELIERAFVTRRRVVRAR